MVLAGLASGKHVVCEKPLVGSLGDADEIIVGGTRRRAEN